ncbi:P-loop containing nucleoside triphosphate hydrolase protein [Microdochium trichocladiopsis]|uniref:P-loop containing nucleoside triphosphate hydrolase protein n=1 Tax=Microdochium trichocladiopsis TaxID=1682393 RepID=A0A9P8Y4F2_9PEZI|nr:P-loop containing nucleoside triphosphate hydrolase protein [Microdochium trichocladiopsis]KAH7029372.1 P-loop containing nucleoside triphosphate hydrolase protein [Microdochium trichocladiopsis]
MRLDHDKASTPLPSTQYEIMRDAGFRHLEDTENDDQRATQRLTARPTIIGDNHAAPNAIIESIECINFMCHVRLHCELGPLLNFIVGENGSGKSAILTAITLCLGGKASATNRGGSLRSFVKEGQEHASLIVKIKNQGDDAYKRDVFGDSIIVERHFTRSGTSGFKLKAESGRTISTKKSDVDDVVEYYCLQVDNPLNVLSQDNARQFLNAATPAQKYKYFTLGTQLEQLSNDYQLILEYLDASEAKLYGFDEEIKHLQDEAEKAVKLRDALQKTAEMKAKQKLYVYKMAWAQIKTQEDLVSEKEAKVVAAQKEVEETERRIAETTRTLDELDSRISAARHAVEELRHEHDQLRDAEIDARTCFDTARTEIQKLHVSERDIHTQLSKARSMVEQHKADIQKEEERLERVNGGAILKAQTERTEAEQARELANKAVQDHLDQEPELKAALARAEEAAQRSASDVEPKRRALAEAEVKVRDLNRKRTDPFAAFGPRLPQLLQAIATDDGFGAKPIGPLGPMIQITKPKWAPVVENLCGLSLSSFLVESKRDQIRLKSLMDRLGIREHPIVILAKTSLGTLKEPDPSFETVLRILKFDDQRVRDLLVINHRIEQALLVETRIAAQSIMFDDQPPQHAAFCMTFHDGRRDLGLRLRNERGNLSSSPFPLRYDLKSRLRSDEETDLKFHQSRVEQLRSELRDVEAARRTDQQAVQRCTQALVQHKRQINVLNNALTSAVERVDAAQEALDDLAGAQNKLSVYREHLKDAEEQRETYGNQYGELRVHKQDMNAEMDELKQKLANAKLAVAENNAKIAKVETKIKNYEASRYTVVVEKNAAHENHDLAKESKRAAEASQQRHIVHLKELTAQAQEVHAERVWLDEGETYESIERKWQSQGEQLRKIRQQLGGTDEQINNRAAESMARWRRTRADHKNVRNLVDSLKQALTDRLDRWRTFQRLISAQARVNFQYLLSERGFRGRLLLDHQHKKLELQVEPDQTRRGGSGRNTKTLSGGEKSFSSICMLLAIWDAMGSPLRCLDEFDVFMDNVNRAISTNMLITAARRSVGKQFILITPNAIEGRAVVDKDVKIIRLVDPRQRRIDDL